MNEKQTPLRLTAAQIPTAAEMLSRAFYDDPFVGQLLPQPERRAQGFARLTTRVLRYGMLYGEVYATSPGIEGVSIWLPPENVAPSVWHMLRAGVAALPFSIGLKAFRRLLSYLDHVDKVRGRHVHVRHWYLQLLGVDPSHQRAGHGGFLLRDMLARCDREGLPCCLDTEKEANVGVYERFGFRVLEASPIPGCDCGFWFMMRDAGAQ